MAVDAHQHQDQPNRAECRQHQRQHAATDQADQAAAQRAVGVEEGKEHQHANDVGNRSFIDHEVPFGAWQEAAAGYGNGAADDGEGNSEKCGLIRRQAKQGGSQHRIQDHADQEATQGDQRGDDRGADSLAVQTDVERALEHDQDQAERAEEWYEMLDALEFKSEVIGDRTGHEAGGDQQDYRRHLQDGPETFQSEGKQQDCGNCQ